MTKDQETFLYRALIKGDKYADIASDLDLPSKTLSIWWEELKPQREHIAEIRTRWKAKCQDLPYEEFRDWYESTPKQCHYCKMTEGHMKQLWEKYPELTKRSRGKKLEIERLAPNEVYDNTKNLVFSCYWCNNAKTDTFTSAEFKKVGKVFQEIWKKRLDA
ncbi:hypothetical protein Oweho_3416 [Owenweeksia hongkongensis DSM 17368]|uniref:HNH endonuclease n=1 Tax=Owenweeksia hongkongensis (strain DSM 17368 / CIP 108786 / JCM 12287 / NRRL B-23963 / UST20020801) TaxID=926562 RepID=G8R5P9_OWEHD|nr:hypothetical protein [Owenweeksia hongkongensis]AEV34365.1 hypothetical protein Oweho_3416 [Owenweeksia hongkongensis DSM 17368]